MTPDPIMQFFVYAHLPQHLQEVSRPFAELAQVVQQLPDNPERDAALRKLLEAKDAAVRARLAKPVEDALTKAPATMEEALADLDQVLGDRDREALLSDAAGFMETQVRIQLGRFLRNRWGLWGDGPLRKHFGAIGIVHPDDMSAAVVKEYIARKKGEKA